MRRSPSLLAQWLEPLAASLRVLFLVWTALVAVVWGFGIGEVELASHRLNPDLLRALQWFLTILDPAWIILGAVNVYRSLATAEGLPEARRQALTIFAVAMLIAWASVLCGFPLGEIHYTGRLGMRLGPVPLALPLLWILTVLSARALARTLLPKAHLLAVCATTAALVLLTNFNLELVAWKKRSWWLWYASTPSAPSEHPPLLNYLTWALAGGLLAWFIDTRRVSATRRTDRDPVLIFILLNAVPLLTYLAGLLR